MTRPVLRYQIAPLVAAARAMHHVTVIQGIHQKLTDPGWTGSLKARLELSGIPVTVETEKYSATGLPYWNVYVKNPRYAKYHANSIAEFSEMYASARTNRTMQAAEPLRIHLIAHSNGTDIALKTVKRLAEMVCQRVG